MPATVARPGALPTVTTTGMCRQYLDAAEQRNLLRLAEGVNRPKARSLRSNVHRQLCQISANGIRRHLIMFVPAYICELHNIPTGINPWKFSEFSGTLSLELSPENPAPFHHARSSFAIPKLRARPNHSIHHQGPTHYRFLPRIKRSGHPYGCQPDHRDNPGA